MKNLNIDIYAFIKESYFDLQNQEKHKEELASILKNHNIQGSKEFFNKIMTYTFLYNLENFDNGRAKLDVFIDNHEFKNSHLITNKYNQLVKDLNHKYRSDSFEETTQSTLNKIRMHVEMDIVQEIRNFKQSPQKKAKKEIDSDMSL